MDGRIFADTVKVVEEAMEKINIELMASTNYDHDFWTNWTREKKGN